MNIPDGYKKCTQCGETLPATTEYFHKKKTGKYGLNSKCKKCRAEYHKQYNEDNKDKTAERWKQYYENNKDKERERKKQYREDNKDKISEYHKQYYENNKDKIKQYREDNKDKISEQRKQYYEDNKDKMLEYFKQYREDNKDKILEYNKQYYEDNKDKITERKKQYYATPQGQTTSFNAHCRRRTRKQNQGNGITKDQWRECMLYFGFRDAYTGEVLTEENRSLDHINPLSQGGEHEIWNLVPMERSLNSSKQDKDLLEWYNQQPFYSEERLQKIYEWQEYAFNKYGK